MQVKQLLQLLLHNVCRHETNKVRHQKEQRLLILLLYVEGQDAVVLALDLEATVDQLLVLQVVVLARVQRLVEVAGPSKDLLGQKSRHLVESSHECQTEVGELRLAVDVEQVVDVVMVFCVGLVQRVLELVLLRRVNQPIQVLFAGLVKV